MKQTARFPGGRPESELTAGAKLLEKSNDKRKIRGDRIQGRWLVLFKF